MRLDKYICKSTGLSRSEAIQAINHKLVKVNHVVVVKKHFDVDVKQDNVFLNEKQLRYIEDIYIMMNKPTGYVSATKDDYQKTVFDLIDGFPKPDLFIVGRLDIDSTGLILITNDGALAHQFMNPKHHIPKIYEVTYTKQLSNDEIQQFVMGIEIKDGNNVAYQTKPAILDVVNLPNCDAIVTLYEGKFHQVKRMFAYFDSIVTSLKRVQIGSLRLDPSLEEGKYKLLTEEEVKILKSSVK